ncbi:beta-propeller fold lactonase family protein [Mesorhizobium sanjuanii]|uniref:beta-propeller fold lactonase family protein n=1 Tax=Mesorhizobium sanjuanii TaxID=2037900 RepID=UPI001FDF5037|nr:beta-propeller fold lactonase family protein [Mesorhizobium sanjuanii]
MAVDGFEKNGALSAPLASVSHKGTGPNATRQERSHAHSVTETIGGGTAVVGDADSGTPTDTGRAIEIGETFLRIDGATWIGIDEATGK